MHDPYALLHVCLRRISLTAFVHRLEKSGRHSFGCTWRTSFQSSSSTQSVLARNRTWSSTFAGSRANPAHPEDVGQTFQPDTLRIIQAGKPNLQYLAEESNPVLQIRSLPCSSITLARHPINRDTGGGILLRFGTGRSKRSGRVTPF